MKPPRVNDSDVVLYHGDTLRVLRELPDESIDLLLTDPPYSSGGMFRGDRAGVSTRTKYVSSSARSPRPDFQGDNRDQRGYLAWASLWLAECTRLLKPGRGAAVFTDWRQRVRFTVEGYVDGRPVAIKRTKDGVTVVSGAVIRVDSLRDLDRGIDPAE